MSIYSEGVEEEDRPDDPSDTEDKKTKQWYEFSQEDMSISGIESDLMKYP